MLEVLIGVAIFTGTRSFDTKSLQFITMNNLLQFVKKVYSRFVTFYFLLGIIKWVDLDLFLVHFMISYLTAMT